MHRAPRIVTHQHCGYGAGLNVRDIDVMVSPYGCWGRPHDACKEAGIPIIVVVENKTVLDDIYPPEFFRSGKGVYVGNYLEAAGVIAAMKSGIMISSVHRPLEHTEVINA